MEDDRFSIETKANPISAGIRAAHLIIGNQERQAEVNADMRAASFLLHLKPGETTLKAWFSGDKNYSANYVHIRRIGPAVSQDTIGYQAVHVDLILRGELVDE